MKTVTLGALVLSLVPSTSYALLCGDGAPEDPRMRQEFKIPARCALQVTVQPGDTLWGLSKRYLGSGSQYEQLAQYNRLSNPNHIQVGDRLTLPGRYDTSKCHFTVDF